MDERSPIRPSYAASFRCIGSACEDTCCQGWKVPVDPEAFDRFRNLPPGPLRTLIDEHIDPRLEPSPKTSAGARPTTFAVFRMVEGNRCPLLTEERLCRIQCEHGADLLPRTCAVYPRMRHTLDRETETGLTLSCPEAARLVLLTQDLLTERAPGEVSPQSGGESAGGEPRSSWKTAVRDTILRLVLNRHYPLWQRLFLIGVLCRRLDKIHLDKESGAGVLPPGLLASFDKTADPAALRGAMASLPADHLAQMDAVLQFAGLMLHKSNVTPRFVECIHAFTTGIGNAPGATLELLADRYAAAYRSWLAPFFQVHPHILENLLVNAILCSGFPFASDPDALEAPRSMARQHAILVAQFALMRGLLVGVAGFHREQFSAEHVVHTVQAASKHFEHHPEFTSRMEALLAQSHLDDTRCLAILLQEPAGKPAGGAAEKQASQATRFPVGTAPETFNPGLASASPG